MSRVTLEGCQPEMSEPTVEGPIRPASSQKRVRENGREKGGSPIFWLLKTHRWKNVGARPTAIDSEILAFAKLLRTIVDMFAAEY